MAFDVTGGRHLTAERLFAVTRHGIPDGIKADAEGRIVLPGTVNFTFGGPTTTSCSLPRTPLLGGRPRHERSVKI